MSNLFHQKSSNGAELAIHLSLGLAAVIAVAGSVLAIFEFATGRDRIAAALSHNPRPLADSNREARRDQAMTNFLRVSLEVAPPLDTSPTNPPVVEPAAVGKPALPTG